MKGMWKKRIDRLKDANEKAEQQELASMTYEKAAEILEGLLSHPMIPPRPLNHQDHPVSLSHRMQKGHV